MALLTDNDDEDSKRICFQCVGDGFLSNRVKRNGLIGRCSYCQNDDEPTFTIDEMADCVAAAFKQHYYRTHTQPTSMQYAMQADKESDYVWDREGEPVDDVIAMAASIPQEAASDIREVLADRSSDWDSAMFGEETDFDGDSYYQSKDIGGGRWQAEWSSFEHSLKTEARFFSRSASQHLTELFDGVDKITARGKKAVLVEAGPGETISGLFRARSFPRYGEMHDALARPDLHLGPPPATIARAGRMNAHGISVFYGANDPLVALAEVRPPVGCSVVVARFDIIRPLKLLDLTALREAMTLGSVFDPQHLDRLQRAAFLRQLSDRITVPVMPEDEGLGYLVTQAIADFLATTNKPAVDGIIFPSVQAKGSARNVVLFHKASRVSAMEIPEGTQIDVNDGYGTEDGWEVDYSVYEKTPPAKAQNFVPNPAQQPTRDLNTVHVIPDADPREPTLAVDPNSVEVHVVEAVTFETTRNSVRRHRYVDVDVPF